MPGTIPNQQAILDVAGLIVDGVAVSEASLAGDIVEARFWARLVADHARIQSLPRVEAKAFELARLLRKSHDSPLSGYARAVLDLSEELDRALFLLRA
jgi:hypothetical protein